MIKQKPMGNRWNKKVFSKKLASGLLFLFIVLLPTQLGKHFFLPFSYLSGIRVDYLAPTVYLVDVVVFLFALLHIRHIIDFTKKKQIVVLIGLFLINVIFSQLTSLAIYQFIKIVEVTIIGIIIYNTAIREKLLLAGLIFSSGLQLLLALLQLINKHSFQGVFYFFGERAMSLSTPGIAKASINGIEILRPYGTFSHPNSMAGYFLIIYFFTLIYKPFNKYVLLKYLLLFLTASLVLVSFSKAAIITMILLTLIFLIFIFKKMCRICIIARLLSLIVIGFIFMQARTDPLTVQKRLELMNNAFIIIVRHPVFGVGIGNYLIAQNQFVSHFSFFFNQPVHNIFLLYFAETGMVLGGVILTISIFLYKKILNYSFLLVIAAICITGLFDHYWLTLQQNILLLGFMGGMSIQKIIKASEASPRSLH